MALKTKEPPEKGEEIIRTAISQLSRQDPAAVGIIAERRAELFSLAAPHPVYFVGLNDVANEKLLSAVKLIGWRYIVLDGDEIVGAANLSFSEDKENLRFSHISYGRFVTSTVRGIGFVENLPEVKTEDYELRVLDIPGLYVVAIWLYGKTNLIIPLPPTIEKLKEFEKYSEQQIMDILKEPAANRLQFDETASETVDRNHLSRVEPTTIQQPGNVELCAASYRAQQVPGAVFIFAEGIHPTSGYHVFFEQSPIDVFPPQFILWHVKPSGIVLNVITPFFVYTSFNAPSKIDAVIVHDTNGKHEVKVEQVPDLLMKHA